jgi:hypothetical protein
MCYIVTVNRLQIFTFAYLALEYIIMLLYASYYMVIKV